MSLHRAVKARVVDAAAPTISTTPAIIGTPQVGITSSYSGGSVSGIPPPTTTQQWTLDGVGIVGATSPTYTPVGGDGGHSLRVVQTATNLAGAASSTSAPTTVTAGGSLTWQFADAATLSPVADASIVLATGAPSGAIFYPSPDPLPGQTLAQSADTILLASDSTLPIADSDRDIVIEVMDTEQATAQIMRSGEMFGAGQTGNFRNIAHAMNRMQDGDVLQISPGSIWIPGNGDGNAYLEGGIFHIWKSCTVQNIPGRGRWRFAPQSTAYVNGYAGIVIREPSQTYSGIDNTGFGVNPRKTIIVEGFDGNNWGITNGEKGIRIRSNSPNDGSTYNDMHASVTLRNFKLGKLAPYTSGSGIGGMAENLFLLDGHVYDCGDDSGMEHNLYCSAVNMTIRGMRLSRSRGWIGTPYWNGNSTVEGHICKVSAQTGTIEGCCIDAVLAGDQSELVQMKAGGNWTIRGNLFVDSAGPNNANGAITMCREMSGAVPNYEWWAGANGNSILFEKNVYVGHYPRPIIWFFPIGHEAAMRASTWPVVKERLDSLTVRDNIAMITDTPATWMLTGFPGTPASAMWINVDPNNGPTWLTRGNTRIVYDSTEAPFSERPLKQYKRAAGPLAAGAGTVATHRFTWPHGSIARSDAYQGLA